MIYNVNEEVVRYYGDSAIDLIEDVGYFQESYKIGRDCETEFGKGVIIGIESNNIIKAVYWIVYIPEINQIHYPLVTNIKFYNTIK